jgi:hypothetical protein
MTVYVNMDDNPVKDRISPPRGIIELYDIQYASTRTRDEQRAIIECQFFGEKDFFFIAVLSIENFYRRNLLWILTYGQKFNGGIHGEIRIVHRH